jgi:glutathione peroxidase
MGGGIKWNFTKFLVDSKGNVVDRFAPTTNPSKLEEKINELIDNQ